MGLGKVIGSGFNVKRWIGYDQIKRDGSALKGIIQDTIQLGKVNKHNRINEDFAACMRRYSLTESDLAKRMQVTLRFARLLTVFGVGLLAYTVYLLLIGHVAGTVITLCLTLFALAKAYREHFNYFQMTQRRLGCNFKEWLQFIFNRRVPVSKSKKIIV